MNLHEFVTAMDRVHDAALRAPASGARDEAVHGIQEATTWVLTVAQRGSGVAPGAIIERARSAARLYGRLRVRRGQDDGDADAVLRDAFAVAGWRC